MHYLTLYIQCPVSTYTVTIITDEWKYNITYLHNGQRHAIQQTTTQMTNETSAVYSIQNSDEDRSRPASYRAPLTQRICSISVVLVVLKIKHDASDNF